MSDNTTLNSGSGGNTFRTFEDGSSIHWPAGVTCFLTTLGTPDVAVPVLPTQGLPVRLADGSGYLTTLPVSIAATVTVTGSGGTFPVTDSGGSLTVDNAGTFAVQVDGAALTSLQLIDNLVLAEDAVHASGDPGVQALAVRRDAAAASAGTDGDYSPLAVDATGRLWCNVGNTVTVGSHDVTNAGTFAVQAAQSGTWNIGTVTSVTAIASALPAGTNAIGKLAANSGVDIGDVDVTSVAPGTGATSLGKAEDAAHTTGDTGVFVLAVRSDTAASTAGTDGDYTALITDSTGKLHVNVGNTVTVASHAVTNAGTFAVQVDGAALTSLQLIDDAVSGTGFNVSQLNGVNVSMGNGASGTGVQRVTLANDSTGVLATVSTVTTVSTLTTLANGQTAHDSVVSGSPLRVGAKAETALSGITLVADGDATDLHAGVDGVLIVREHCNLEDVVQERTTNTDGASTAFASGLAAPGAGVRLWITSVDICNSSASFCTVDLRDGAAGSVLWTLPVPATGGVVKTFNPPLKLTANTALAFDASAATSTLTISANGFRSKV